jgi:hypothetical protein
VELTDNRPDFQMSIAAEYYPLAKIISVPGDATAYNRIPYPNVLNIIRWKDNTPENTKWAQMSSRKLLGIIKNGDEFVAGDARVDGYGNYGE